MLKVPEYCRELEAYLCRKNDGHLIRIVGPSFEVVSRWATLGVPLKVACSGIDRYFERYYRKGPRRRPVRIDFCDADVLDVFDEWRRAIGLTGGGVPAPETSVGAPAPADAGHRRGPSLPEHLERVLIRLSSLRARGLLPDAADPVIDRVSSELDCARGSAGGLRGEARRAALNRLSELDRALLETVARTTPADTLDAITREAAAELASYRDSMPAEAFAEALERATSHALRERVGLPTIAIA